MRGKLYVYLLVLLCSANLLAQSAPTLLSPANGSTGVLSSSQSLVWYYITTTPVTYTLQVSQNSSFTGSMVLNTTITGGINYYNNVPGLFNGTTYYWRVRAADGSGTGPWSSTWSFTTSGTPPAPFTITASAGANGSLSPSGSVSVTPGSDKTFTITPSPGYIVNDVLVDGVSAGALTTYTFYNVVTSHTISASFTPAFYTVTASAGAGGSISPSGSNTVTPGGSISFSVTPAAGYHITDIIVDGVSAGADTSFTFNNVTANHTINAVFSINQYTVTITHEGIGTTTPNGVVPVNHGSYLDVNFHPASGYFVLDVIVNGVSQGPSSSVSLLNILGNQTVHVKFANRYSITATATAGGSISFPGTTLFIPSESKTYTFTPFANFYLSDLIVDGVSVDSTAQYTFSFINSNHTIHAVFSHIVDTVFASVLGDSGGTISPAGEIIVNRGDSIRFNFTPDPGYANAGFTFNSVSMGYDSTFLIPYVNGNQTIVVQFRPARNIYVSVSGSDITGNGTFANPFATIIQGNLVSLPGDTIVLSNGTFNQVLFALEARNYRGSGATYVNKFVAAVVKYFTVKDINIIPASIPSPSFEISNSSNFRLENLSVNTPVPFSALQIYNSSYFSVLNSNFSNTNTKAVVIFNSNNFLLSGISAYNNYSGIDLDSVSSFTLKNIITNNSNYGIAIDDSKNGYIYNLTSNNNNGMLGDRAGLIISSSSGLNFIDGEMYNNGFVGVYISGVRTLSFSINPVAGTNNITFSGNFNISHNPFGIYLQPDNLGMTSITNPVFDGNFLLDDNIAADVSVENKVLSPVFKGFYITKDTVMAANSFIFSGLPGVSPLDAVINDCVFGTGVGPAIRLNSYTKGLYVDARYNDFQMLTLLNQIPFVIIDSSDTPMNTDLGVVDYSGSSVGLDPSISPDNVLNGYKGATYFINVNIDVKQTPYYFIQGKYHYDITKLDYLGFVSDGIFNDKGWIFNVSENTPGEISFTGFGINPVNTDGSLFKLVMKILETADGTNTSLTALNSEFTGNALTGAFQAGSNNILYTDAPGPLQSRGDVTLDNVVTMSDFYALLFHLGGSVLLTDPQALSNADFELDSDVDFDDLNALYTFITTGILPSAPVVASASFRLNNIAYDNSNESVNIPVELTNASNFNSLEVTMKFNPDLLTYKVFNLEGDKKGKIAYAYQPEPGIVKFVYTSAAVQQGNIKPGQVILAYKEGKLPSGSEISTVYRLNGKQAEAGPTYIFNETGAVVSVKQETNAVPDKYELSQNYPNPFNPSTTIRFSLPEASDVVIKVYDMLGQQVLTLVNEFKNAGSYSVIWDGKNDNGKNVTSGTYIYRISAGTFVQTKKMVLMK